jgi:hypothetical protein
LDLSQKPHELSLNHYLSRTLIVSTMNRTQSLKYIRLFFFLNDKMILRSGNVANVPCKKKQNIFLASFSDDTYCIFTLCSE